MFTAVLSMEEIDNFNFPIVRKHYMYEPWVRSVAICRMCRVRVSGLAALKIGESFAEPFIPTKEGESLPRWRWTR